MGGEGCAEESGAEKETERESAEVERASERVKCVRVRERGG